VAVEALADRLAGLLDQGFLPASRLAPRSRRTLQPLFDAGVLEEVRSGGGRRVVVRDRPALERFARSTYPAGLDGAPTAALPARSAAVATVRDAKRARTTDAEPVLLRGFGDACLQRSGELLEVAAWTRRAGLTAVRLDDGSPWGFAGTVAVVENLEVFLYLERLGLACDLALYAGGRLSGRALRWLASPPMGDCCFLHCGDYDPVGLDEYLRLAAACPGRTQLHLPEDLEALLATYGKAELLRASPGVLTRLRRSPDPTVSRVVALLDRYGAGLEQEILLAVPPPPAP
jgi:hypothetical protein